MRTDPVHGIVFDKDGTLFDFARTWEAWASAFLQRLAPDFASARRLGAAVGFDVSKQAFQRGSIVIAGTPWEISEALAPHLPDMAVPEIFELINEEAARAPQSEAVPLKPLLDDLRASSYRLGVATNDAEVPARTHLAAVDVIDRFDVVFGCDSGHGAKPDPGQLLAFCRETGLAPRNCVMIGDSRHDLAAGRAAGFATIGVLTGYARSQDLVDLADDILPDIGHLPDWLESGF